MKTLLLACIAIILLLSVAENLLAQTNKGDLFLTGVLLDKVTDEPVSYASLSITGSTSGTASDDKGNFQIKVESAFTNQKVSISCIGYETKEFSIDSLRKITVIKIFLKPSSLLLEQVYVKTAPPDPSEIVKEALAAIPKNYRQEPFNMELYCKLSVRDLLNVPYSIESILLAYRKGYGSQTFTLTRVLQKRENGLSPFSPMVDKKTKTKIFPFYSGFDVSLTDQIGSGPGQYSLFNPSTFKKFKFRYAGITVFDQDTVCAIEYSRHESDVDAKDNSGELTGKFNGMIWISVNNLAIIRHTLKIGNQLHDIIYKKQDGKYFPYLMKNKTDRTAEVDKKVYSIVDEIYLRYIRTDPVEIIERDPANWYPENIAFNEAWWNANVPVTK